MGNQVVSYTIRNYMGQGVAAEIVAMGNVSVNNNAAVFPRYVFPKGVSHYVLTFMPKLLKPALTYNKLHIITIGNSPVASKNTCQKLKFSS